MSITKLKSARGRAPAPWHSGAKPRTDVRGRVITGMLTGGGALAEPPAVPEDRQEEPEP